MNRPPPYPDLVGRKEVRDYLHEKTGQLVSEQRIGKWISEGEIRMVSVPCSGGYQHYTRRVYLNELIARHTFSPVPNPPNWLSRFPVSRKREFGFIAREATVHG
jgi:hypothetical protein